MHTVHYKLLFALFCVAIHPRSVLGAAQTQAWLYDAAQGDVACGAATVLQNNIIDVLKPGFISLDNDGNLGYDETTSTCNGGSPANIALWKQRSSAQYLTVGSSDNGVTAVAGLVLNSAKAAKAVTDLTAKVVSYGVTGIEIDFEGYENWNATIYSQYVSFLNDLGASLHAQGKQLMIDVPAIHSQSQQNYYQYFTYEGLNNAAVDFICIMSYDGHYEGTCGTPVASNTFVNNTIQWAFNKLTNHSKIIMGVPAYGYHCPTGTSNFGGTDTLSQSQAFTGFNTAQRDPNSYEMMWTNGGNSYVYQDQTTLDMKRALIESWGIQSVSVWFIGGNAWFSPAATSTTTTTTSATATTTATANTGTTSTSASTGTMSTSTSAGSSSSTAAAPGTSTATLSDVTTSSAVMLGLSWLALVSVLIVYII